MASQARVESVYAMWNKVALARTAFLAYIPPLLCLYLMGVLVQLKGTRFYRLAFLPVTFWLAWRGTFSDMSGGDPKQTKMNMRATAHMCYVLMRATAWAVAKEPFYRQSLPTKRSNKSDEHDIRTALWNAMDLMWNLRGVGWSWSRGTVFPKPTFETDSRVLFALWSAARLVFVAFGFDACLQTIRAFSPDTFGSLNGGCLFDHTLPRHLELLRAVVIGFLTIWMIYFSVQLYHHLLAMVCTIVFQHHPSQWPPLFDRPWLSTSLSELWGRRWHQMLRETLVALGFRPFNYLFGPLGGLLGVFLVSGIFHYIEVRSLGQGGNPVALIGFWVMNGLGVVLERVWKRYTGRRVDGIWGWLWTFGWLALWGFLMVDEWAKAGRFRVGELRLPGGLESPSIMAVKFVRKFLDRSVQKI